MVGQAPDFLAGPNWCADQDLGPWNWVLFSLLQPEKRSLKKVPCPCRICIYIYIFHMYIYIYVTYVHLYIYSYIYIHTYMSEGDSRDMKLQAPRCATL